MKLVGMIFIVASAGSVGFRIAVLLKRRCMLVRQFLRALQLLRNEISFCGTPLPQAFALMAASCDGQLARLFSDVAKDMDRRRWVTPQAAMEKALEETPEELLKPILIDLTKRLGKYDLDAQMQGIDTAYREAELLLQTLEQERSLKSRTYETLGICAGLAAVILLL